MIKFKELMVNVIYTFGSNLISLIISIIITFLLPKLLGVEDYGFYQLYLFYTSYVGILHLGWCDGIYLRYGGKEYSKLDKSILSGQFYSFVFLELIITFIGFIVIWSNNSFDLNHRNVIFFFICNIVIMNVRTFLLFLLQTTNRIKEYSLIIVLDRLFFLFLVLLFVVIKIVNFNYYIIADIFAKSISLIYIIVIMKDVTLNYKDFKLSIIETKSNILSGINLLFAYISGLLIVGFVRMGIQKNWGIETFSNVSLTLSISNMLMIFINSVSLALFPVIKRMDKESYSDSYNNLKSIMMPVMTILLILYYPMILILSKWLPQYTDALTYMSLVFPIVLFECKFNLLILTYLKAIRREKYIFYVNFVMAIISWLLSWYFIYILNNLILAVLLITLLMILKCYISEYLLSKDLSITLLKDYFLDILTVIFFVTSSWFFDLRIGICIYFMYLCFYFLVQIKFFIRAKNELFRNYNR